MAPVSGNQGLQHPVPQVRTPHAEPARAGMCIYTAGLCAHTHGQIFMECFVVGNRRIYSESEGAGLPYGAAPRYQGG